MLLALVVDILSGITGATLLAVSLETLAEILLYEGDVDDAWVGCVE